MDVTVSKTIFVTLISIVGIGLSFWVFLSNKSARVNRLLFADINVLILSLLLDHFSVFFNGEAPLYFIRLSYAFLLFSVAIFYRFVQYFPFEDFRNKFSQTLSALFLPLFFLFGLIIVGTPFVVEEAYNFGESVILGNLVWSYYLALVILIVISFINLINKYKKSTKSERQKIRFLLGGIVIYVIFQIVFNLILPVFNIQNYYYLGDYSIILFIAFTVYAIVKRHLFNVRLAIARSISYSFLLATLTGIYVAVTFMLSAIFSLGYDSSTGQVALNIATSLLLVVLFQPLRRFFDKITNKIFYRDAYDMQELLNNINSSIVSTTDLRKLLEATAREIKANIKVSFCNFYIDSKTVLEFHNAGTNVALFNGEKWESLLGVLEISRAKIFSEEHGSSKPTLQLMYDLKTDVILRLTSQNQNVGYLVVGQKQSGSSFTAQDAQILEIIADEVAIAVQNTLRYEEITLFNVTLQQKIKNAIAELQRNNQKLKALDEAKDEFISMASHQLRTPLTSVKGYLSMLLENDAGKLNAQQRRFLDQAFISSQRMVYLIADLLNVSRLKTGKFVIEAKPTYLPDLVESEIAQLHETALARGLEMVFDKPKEFPTLNLDETKIRQVIMNFADNAIHYTPKGGKITLELKQTDESVEFTVTDTGIGVPKAEVHKLFTKFYRAGNARKARPDGTGLGIFMAKKVVMVQGGAVIFKTEEGKGSTFGFTFPRAKLEVKSTEK